MQRTLATPRIHRRRLLAGFAVMVAARPLTTSAKSTPLTSLGGMLGSDFGLVADSDADQSALLQKAVDTASGRGLPLHLTGGTYRAGNIKLTYNVTIGGMDGGASIIAVGGAPVFHSEGQSNITLRSLDIDGTGGGPVGDRTGLVALSKCENVRLDTVSVHLGPGNGVYLDGCSGVVRDSNSFGHGLAGLFAINSHDLTISQNRVFDCGNAGILVWQDANGTDGTIVTGNHVARIAAKAGGSGQNGNGINIFRADNVIVSDNVITDCAFSAVRANSTRNVAIRGNNCTNLDEVAIYSEFAFSGSVIADNIVDGAAAGISITNLDQGGQLAVCSGNIVRNITPTSSTNPDVTPYGIYAEADTAITGNTVSAVPGVGIAAGNGKFLRNVLIANNVISGADTGIGVSVAEGAGGVRISGNMISGSKAHAIVGLRWTDIATPDLMADAAQFHNVSIEGNTISR